MKNNEFKVEEFGAERVFERPERQGSKKAIRYVKQKYTTKKAFSYTAMALSVVALAAATVATGVLVYFVTAGGIVDQAQGDQVRVALTNPGVGTTSVEFEPNKNNDDLQKSVKNLADLNVDTQVTNLGGTNAGITDFLVVQAKTLAKSQQNTNDKVESLYNDFIQQHFQSVETPANPLGPVSPLSTTGTGTTALDELVPQSGTLGVKNNLQVGSSGTGNTRSLVVSGLTTLAGGFTLPSTADATLGRNLQVGGTLEVTGDTTLASLSAGATSLTGALLLSTNPTLPLHAATKQYVDARIGSLSTGTPPTTNAAGTTTSNQNIFVSYSGSLSAIDATNSFSGTAFIPSGTGSQTIYETVVLVDTRGCGGVFNFPINISASGVATSRNTGIVLIGSTFGTGCGAGGGLATRRTVTVASTTRHIG